VERAVYDDLANGQASEVRDLLAAGPFCNARRLLGA
jgi:hypothetical protein